jgi:hypothetical protein
MQNGSLTRIRRERGPNVWAYRWREPGPTGKIVYHNLVIGTMEQFPDKPAALKRPYWGQAIRRHHIHPVLRRLASPSGWDGTLSDIAIQHYSSTSALT